MNYMLIFFALFYINQTNIKALKIDTLYLNEIINIKQKGAIGDGQYDDWLVIQKTIDEVINSGGGTIYFPKGDYAIYDKSIVIWGDNIKLIGDGPDLTKIIKVGKVGYFGDCIDISGKINGYQYYGEFGKGDYNIIRFYRGKSINANNVELQDLTITSNLQKQLKFDVANNLGILNATNVSITNCVISGANQSNVSIVNDTNSALNGNIIFKDCVFRDSKQHNVRVNTYNRGRLIGNIVKFTNCTFSSVLGKDKLMKELRGKQIHLWYRGGKTGQTSIDIENCNFDKTGMIFVNSNSSGFSLKNSIIKGGLNIQHSPSLEKNPRINISGNIFYTNNEQNNYMRTLLIVNQEKRLKNGFTKTGFGSVYPSILRNSENVKIVNNSYR